ncbi:MAG: trypsin-like peptidase domain-containing protein [Actinomycetia bacterium]|nr:trypsin-like peptidase domain-containing protein [Actinomycetes bacterium]
MSEIPPSVAPMSDEPAQPVAAPPAEVFGPPAEAGGPPMVPPAPASPQPHPMPFDASTPFAPPMPGPGPFVPPAAYGAQSYPGPFGASAPYVPPMPGPGALPIASPPGPVAANPVQPRGRHPLRAAIIAAAVAGLVGGGIGAGAVAAFDHRSSSSPSAGLQSTSQSTPTTPKTDGTITAAAQKIQPSVVTINVTGELEQGTGSGVIIRADGYILTNYHVVSVAASGGTIAVVTADGQQATATVVGTDPSDDLAVIKTSGLTGLTAATFASSAGLVVGQSVVAVGAPLGLSNTVTSGIVSNTARPVRAGDNDAAVFNAIQTDAAINPGNSGGPLVDLNGDVVGINSAIASTGGQGLQVPGAQQQSGSIGIGFAIPSDEASRIAGELITTGKATHAVIGATVATDQSAVGAVIRTVTAGSPADKAGLKSGDVVTMLDDQRVQDADGLIAAIRTHAPGQTVTLSITSDGAAKTVSVQLGEATDG